jgi:hypothetical protein
MIEEFKPVRCGLMYNRFVEKLGIGLGKILGLERITIHGVWKYHKLGASVINRMKAPEK